MDIILKKLQDIEVLINKGNTPVLKISEVSEITGLSKSCLYKLTASKEIPHYKKAKHLYFDRDEVVSWLKSNKVKSNQEIEKEALSYTFNKKGGLNG